MGNKKLQKVLLLHKDWLLSNGAEGSRANLQHANLRHANLQRANLRDANIELTQFIICYGVPKLIIDNDMKPQKICTVVLKDRKIKDNRYLDIK